MNELLGLSAIARKGLETCFVKGSVCTEPDAPAALPDVIWCGVGACAIGRQPAEIFRVQPERDAAKFHLMRWISRLYGLGSVGHEA